MFFLKVILQIPLLSFAGPFEDVQDLIVQEIGEASGRKMELVIDGGPGEFKHDHFKVVVRYHGLLDDSVMSEEVTLDIQKKEDEYVVVEKDSKWKCWPSRLNFLDRWFGRGTGFSKKPCP